MLKNYFVIAWRQLLKNKLYAAINILGLMVGLWVYLFSSLLIDYEQSYDSFYQKVDRIFTVSTVFGPAANVGVSESDGVYSAFGPLIATDVGEVEAVARTVGREFLLSVEDDHYYERIRFADPEFLDIFDFVYLEGDDTALDDPSGVLMSRSTATKFFGDTPAYGRTVTLDHEHTLRVAAVVEDLPANTHLKGSLISDQGFTVVAPLKALDNASGYPMEGNWNNLSSGDFTYMLLPAGTDRAWLQAQLDGVYERHYPNPEQEFVAGLKVRPLMEANTIIWDQVGLPILETIRMLGVLVLIVAFVNYTNLATAQSLGRAREIGLRKTLGARRRQLVVQFLVESLCVATVSMVIALVLLAVFVPVFNTITAKGLSIDYLGILPWVLGTTTAVGVIAGAYPAYLITRASPIDALRDGNARGGKGGLFRSAMLTVQFSITIFMMAMVLVMFLQNRSIADSAEIYPKSQIITLSRLTVESINERLDTLKNELKNIPGVTHVAYTSHLPFEFSNSNARVSRDSGGEETDTLINRIIVDEEFFDALNIPLLAGRILDSAIAADTTKNDVLAANVVVNKMVLEKLGFDSPEQALGEVFYELRGDAEPRTLTIVGVIPSQNYQGFHNEIKPTMYYLYPAYRYYAVIRVENVAMNRVVTEVESVWDEIVPDYPIQSEFLDEAFNETYQIYQGLAMVLGSFALVALLLSLIGLFGLAAFMATRRTKEIGVRKVMGASMFQVVRLLIWQLSRPVMWALIISLPLAYFASNMYLEFFADRIGFTIPIVLIAGVGSVLLAWAIVAVHAVRVARANPIHALRYE